MFVELMPLLAGRTVMMTVAREDDKTLRVNVIPKMVKDDENPALTTPLTYSGTPEELDAQLGKHLASYIDATRNSAVPWPKPKPKWRLQPRLPRRRPVRRLPSGARKQQTSQPPTPTRRRRRQRRLHQPRP